ncbi:TrbI/VirB10 family protein [Escherichia coli]|uniref:TrbI/VirB10 family protein n=1 Tax=Escherichia coli TaxID=562 RepID=A0A826Y0J2_ECOLX|nr:TrbI/VirB10 family protein [Escherichia coli]EES2369946.1 TrbI/VirB10 family protein [Escherichia coli]EEU4485193.1 TrbI/VirB10 family protein [Escherichia coli]EEV0339262.1 TrbI/VirB10 family protein [Escherichia coli]EEV5626513.1 TrbI/VirB10 family protein [Escherichia coli]
MKNNSDIVFEKLDEIDSREVDTDAQNRNFIHSGKKQGNKKAKAIFILAVFAFVTVVILTAVLSKVFSSSEEEKATETASTKAQAEVYTRNTQAKNLDDLKEAVASSIEEVKDNVNSEEEQAREEARPENKGVTLPTENETDAGYAQSNSDAPPTPAQRRLMGSVMVDDNRISQSQPSGQKTAAATSATSDNTNVSDNGDFLQGAEFANGTVSRIKNRSFLLSAGTTFSCVLKTKIVTTYPGVTLCQLTKDVISDDGKNVLIRAGAQLQGEQTRAITQGMARVFVNWTIVKDKNNRVRIDSLGTDSLGASGLPAWVDTHFWKRFGGALMLSLIEDSIAAGTSRMSRTNNSEFTMNNTTGTSSELAKTTLDNSINIPPTGYVNQGEMLTVIVPRNIDFSSVYGVR